MTSDHTGTDTLTSDNTGTAAANTAAATDVSVGLDDLPPLLVDGRIDRLRDKLEAIGVDAAVITDRANIRWLTGFTGTNGTLVVGVTSDVTLLITDGRYASQAPAQLADAHCDDLIEVVISNAAVTTAADRFSEVKRLGLEVTVSWGEQRRWNDAFSAELMPLTETIEELRAVKDEAELARISAAAGIADAALNEVLPRLRPGQTEMSIQQSLDEAMRQRGAIGPAYDTIMASGPNSALPHARPTSREMEAGDLVVIDVGAEVDGYRSDMTRTFVLGPPSPQAKAMIDLVTSSQAAGVAAVRPNIEAGEIDNVCRDVINSAGMGEAFMHSTGHGVGLHIHELPRISSKSVDTLRPGHVLTVEPGVYFEGVGGVRVEDLVVVTNDGCRPLTQHPKNPFIAL